MVYSISLKANPFLRFEVSSVSCMNETIEYMFVITEELYLDIYVSM